jgi:hypothetical protein
MESKPDGMILLEEGDKVLYKGEVYDFGYIGGTGKAILYYEGERNMQDSFAVPISEISKVEEDA